MLKNKKNTFLITGAAGFIGAALVIKLLKNGQNVIGIDNLNNYYDKNLKKSRLDQINKQKDKSSGEWVFKEISIENIYELNNISDIFSPNIVVHLAAQAGVRNSILNPNDYFQTNLLGFGNILEFCRNNNTENFIFASSSSVYGANRNYPFKENQSVDHPVSLYAATKKSNEIMAHSYSHLYNIPTTGLRFFTVYGPWGRPDMAPMIFAKSIIEGKEINIFNYGDMVRDFTYIDDIVDAIFSCCFKPANKEKFFNYNEPDPSLSFAPFKIFNVGNSKPVKLLDFISHLEDNLGCRAKKNFIEMQKGDVKVTSSECTKLSNWIDFSPRVNINKGIKNFADWYLDFYKDY